MKNRKLYQKEYRATHKKEIQEKRKAYDKLHKDKLKEQHKAYNKKYAITHKEQLLDKQREYHKKHKEKIKQYYLIKKYNINSEEYNELLIKQNGVCAICFKMESAKHKSGTLKQLSVDHCHETNKVRGLLCTRCNTAIGLLQDNVLLLESAKQYLCKK